MQKNIDDNDFEERLYPQKSTLFLRINKKENSTYEAILSLKSEGSTSINQILETVQLNISEDLFLQVNSFQSLRRGVAVSILRSGFETNLTENWEATLSEAIYQTFFSGEIGIICHDFLDKLQRNKIQELLLVISTVDERIQNLPWEMVLPRLNPDGDYGLPKNNFGLIRSREETWNQFDLRGSTVEYAPLKLLFIPALPENLPETSKTLEIEKEQRKIIDAVRALEVTGDLRPKLVMEILDCADLEEIKKSLRSNSHDIVHISGHGAYAEEIKAGILHLENEDGDEQKTTGHELGKVLKEFSSIKLVVLSACETAVGGAEGSTAEQIAAVGLPAVLAMRFSVSDEGAIRFSEKLYERLADGDTLTKAVHEARIRLWEDEMGRQRNASVNKRAEWYTPVLYQNQPISSLVKLERPEQYNFEILNRIYPKVAFVKENHTRLIGEGFIGRKRLLIQLRQLFKQGKHVCLHGLGGLGKTTTAEAFANHYQPRCNTIIFRNGAEINEAVILERVFTEWNEITKPKATVAQQLKARLDDPNVEIEQKIQALINNCLNGHRTILIFDNFEDVQTDEDGELQQTIVSESLRLFLRNLLQKAPRTCHVLFTTRYLIPDFDNLVTHRAINKMSYAEQYRFLNFSETLRRLPEKERDIIHRRIDGHPRALEFLEGLFTKDQTFDLAYLDKVDVDFSEKVLLERILSRLNAAEQEVFTVASVFFSRSPLAALSAVMEKENEELMPVLASLRDWSLCFWDEMAQTFEVHALTRAWMRSKGKPDQQQFEGLSENAGDYFRKLASVEALLNAIGYFENAKVWSKYTETIFRLENYFNLIGYYPAEIELNILILKNNILPKNNAQALNNLGTIKLALGDYKEALEYFEQSLVILRQVGDRSGEYEVLGNISHIFKAWGDYRKAFEYSKNNLEIYRKDGYKKGEGHALESIGRLYYLQGSFSIALKNLQDSLKIYQQLKYKRGEGAVLNNIGLVYIGLEEYPTALKYLEDSLRIYNDIQDVRGQGSSFNDIGQIYLNKGEYELAIEFFEKSRTIRQKIGDKDGIGITYNCLGNAYFYLGEYKLSLEYFEQSLDIHRQTGNLGEESRCLNNISQICIRKGAYKKALDFLGESLKIQDFVGDKEFIGVILCNMAEIYFQYYEDYVKAIRLLFNSYLQLKSIKSPQIYLTQNLSNHFIQKIGKDRFNQILESIKNNPPT
ncbi:tetratricopeptide repeat protein [Larkinella sp. GY13]|uniref:tetratricopeptide repeat protein n=1 Tax=Larkinella sp. GY13 TaxID=3453720 RepID=UPI003EEA133E